MTRRGFWIRMAISIAIDILDFTFGRIPIFGMAGEGVSGLILAALWGPAGLLYLGELGDFTEQIDAFVPTATIIGLYVGWRNGFVFRRRSEVPSRADRP